jgi:formamidopyrimidine-DNA glycosylase
LPELPEVETIKRTLEERIVGKRIKCIQVLLEKMVLPLNVEQFKIRVEGSIITGLGRRGKYLLVHLSFASVLIISLRMTGRLIFVPSGKDILVNKHTHLVFEFDDGSFLYFNDVRKFGTIHCVPVEKLDNCPEIAKLGPEPLGPEFSETLLKEMLHTRRKKIKQLLLDQTFIAGIGNIYADEILFQAGIHPETLSKSLTSRQVHSLFRAIVGVLNEGVKHRGTTIKDYVDGDGITGNYQDYLKVYGRKGKKCYNCGKQIETIKLGGRTAHFCPGCQREGI